MSYICRYINDKAKLPLNQSSWIDSDHEPIYCTLETTHPPIYKKIIGSDDKIWGLEYVTRVKTDDRYDISAVKNIIPQDKDEFNAYYWEIKPGGDRYFTITPYLIKADSTEGPFDPGEKFVDFSVYTDQNYVDTDTMTVDTVTATVHNDLPGLTKQTGLTITEVKFDRFFIYAQIPIIAYIMKGWGPPGSPEPPVLSSNQLLAHKNQQLSALAIFKEIVNTRPLPPDFPKARVVKRLEGRAHHPVEFE